MLKRLKILTPARPFSSDNSARINCIKMHFQAVKKENSIVSDFSVLLQPRSLPFASSLLRKAILLE
jgi:hypothetical protein